MSPPPIAVRIAGGNRSSAGGLVAIRQRYRALRPRVCTALRRRVPAADTSRANGGVGAPSRRALQGSAWWAQEPSPASGSEVAPARLIGDAAHAPWQAKSTRPVPD